MLPALVLCAVLAAAPGAVQPAEKESYCKRYGTSGHPAHVVSCTDGEGSRTVTCAPGYVVAGSGQAEVTLRGQVPFAGCVAAR